MTDQYPASDGYSGKIQADAGAGRPAGWPSAPPPNPGPPPAGVGQDRAALPTIITPVTPVRADAPYVQVTQDQSPPKLYAHKNELLYAFGGLFFPGLVLLLMGQKKQGIIMLCCWLACIALSVVLIGIPLLVATYVWSVVACFREARRQNEAHGFVS